ncbi:MAG: sensor histidine kinase N-terminal domain-containing protein [Bdellovibrio sp.]|nr:sensor histidine kinase N-terminal domain-containing protein [Methylotenera sp.]
MQKKQASLRKKLLSWLMPLLLLLILIDSTLLFKLAIGKLEKEIDADLFSSAQNVSQFLINFGNAPKDIRLLENASHVFLKDEVDQILYSITDSQGLLLSGSQALQATTQVNNDAQHSNSKTVNKADHYYFNTNIGNEHFRVVSATFNITNLQGAQTVTIQIAGTQKWRGILSNTILIGIVVPQLLLALLSFFIIWYGIKKGLAPLDALQDAVSKRSEHDLSPIELPNIPQEVSLVANSVNQLMTKLQHLIAAQNRFVADAAHQLRTPLAGAQAQLELAEQAGEPSAIKALLPRAYLSLDKLLHTINQLLALARSQPEAAASVNMVLLDLNVLTKEIALEIAPAAIKKQIDLGFEPSLVPAIILGNVDRLNDLLNNLMDNAIRYTQAGGKVTVALDVSEKQVNLSVEDDGPGVSDAEKDKIFDRFHRVIDNYQIVNEQTGSGLGLAIVKEIASLHGASIRIADGNMESEATVTHATRRGLKVMISFKRLSNLKMA